MKEPVHQHHLDVQLHHGAHQISGVHFPGRDERCKCVDSGTGHVLQHDHALPCKLGEDDRNRDFGIEREVRSDALGVLTFLAKIHLITDPSRELAEYCAQSEHVWIRKETLGPSQYQRGRLDVRCNGQLDTRAQHFHDYINVEITRAVNLSEGGRCEWNARPVGEDLIHRATVTLLNYTFYLFHRDRWYAIGQSTYGAQVWFRE